MSRCRKILITALAVAFAPVAVAQNVPVDKPAFTEHVAGLLRKTLGDTPVSVAGVLTVRFGEFQANLDRIFDSCKHDTKTCPAEVKNYVEGVAEAYKEQAAAPSRDAVRVVLRSEQYVQAALSTGAEVEMQPHPFVGGLVALPVLDSPRMLRMLGAEGNARLGLSAQAVYDLGIANLRKGLKPLLHIAPIAGPGRIGQFFGDSFYPSRLLLIDYWTPLANAQGGVLIVAVPTTDAVLYIGEDTPVAIDALRTLVNSMVSKSPNRLSNVLLRWKQTGWEVVP
ncbi:MAG: hypothetical protein LBE50_03505 [Gallionellaceae bacterium]|jgi:hypothetical protein|nr:hypothetical protein [Gallionellaceae bacterium]